MREFTNAIFTSAVIVSLAGCAAAGGGARSVDETFAATPGVKVDDTNSLRPIIESITYERSSIARDERLPLCISTEVSNEAVQLTGSKTISSTPIGIVKGSNNSTLQGGNVLEYVSENKRTVVSQGTARFSHTFLTVPIDKSLRFTLEAASDNNGTKYHFSNIETAQLDTGSSDNLGYRESGAWSDAKPDLVYESLEEIVNDIDKCLKR